MRMGHFWLVLALAANAVAQDGAQEGEGPALSAVSVVNAADLHAGPVAPSEVVVLYPTRAGPSRMAPWAVDAMHMSQYSVDSLGGARVLFDGVAAPLVYAESGRICAIVPYRVTGKTTTEVVVEYQGKRSAPVELPVVPSAPALFTLDATGVGQAAMLNETGCCNSVRNPAVRGSVASLYATGEGFPLPGAPQGPMPRLPVRVTVGGVPAQILWTGNVGVLQANFRIPANAPVGDAVPLVLTVGNARSSAPVTMAVRSQRQQILVAASDLALRRRLGHSHAGRLRRLRRQRWGAGHRPGEGAKCRSGNCRSGAAAGGKRGHDADHQGPSPSRENSGHRGRHQRGRNKSRRPSRRAGRVGQATDASKHSGASARAAPPASSGLLSSDLDFARAIANLFDVHSQFVHHREQGIGLRRPRRADAVEVAFQPAVRMAGQE